MSQHGLEEVTRFYDIRVDSKDHLISEMSKLHPTSRWTQLSNIWTEEELKRIRSVVMNGVSSYRSFISDVTSDIEDIGESEPLQVVTAVDEKTGKVRESYRCDNSLLVPNGSKTKCILPARLDVGYHHLVTGGINAWREGADRLISRMLSFSHIFHSLDNTLNQELPEFKQLFESPEYLEGALEICEGKNVLDPIQLSIVIQLHS